jgi:hypothetical protein
MVDDGSKKPVKALTYAPLATSNYVAVTGVIGVEKAASPPGAPAVLVLRVRGPFDVRILSGPGAAVASASSVEENSEELVDMGSTGKWEFSPEVAPGIALTYPAQWYARAVDLSATRKLIRSLGESADWLPVRSSIIGRTGKDLVEVKVYDCPDKNVEDAVASIGGDASSLIREFEANKARAAARGAVAHSPALRVSQSWVKLGSSDALVVENGSVGTPSVGVYLKEPSGLVAINATGKTLEDARSVMYGVLPALKSAMPR